MTCWLFLVKTPLLRDPSLPRWLKLRWMLLQPILKPKPNLLNLQALLLQQRGLRVKGRVKANLRDSRASSISQRRVVTRDGRVGLCTTLARQRVRVDVSIAEARDIGKTSVSVPPDRKERARRRILLGGSHPLQIHPLQMPMLMLVHLLPMLRMRTQLLGLR